MLVLVRHSEQLNCMKSSFEEESYQILGMSALRSFGYSEKVD